MSALKDAELISRFTFAKKRWPGVELSIGAFSTRVDALLSGSHDAEEQTSRSAIAALRAEDIYLACACLEGDDQALRQLDQLITENTEPALRANRASPDEIDDIIQRLRIKLLVSDSGKPPALALYSGRGDLRGFLRTAAVRIQLNLHRSKRRRTHTQRTGIESLELLASSSKDAMLERLKERYLDEFRNALRASWAELDDESRLMLEHQLIDQLNIDHLARIYNIHRSTAARRLVAAREELLRLTQRRLITSLELPHDQLSSVIRLIRSRIDGAADVLAAEGSPTTDANDSRTDSIRE